MPPIRLKLHPFSFQFLQYHWELCKEILDLLYSYFIPSCHWFSAHHTEVHLEIYLSGTHCKYVQFLIVSTFHCNLVVRFTLIALSTIQSNVEVTVKKTVNQFTIFLLYLEQQLNVNRTVRLQWKVDTIKNCIYLQCMR